MKFKTWMFFQEKDGYTLADYASTGLEGEYERAGEYAQTLADKFGVGIGFCLDEGASCYRYPKSKKGGKK